MCSSSPSLLSGIPTLVLRRWNRWHSDWSLVTPQGCIAWILIRSKVVSTSIALETQTCLRLFRPSPKPCRQATVPLSASTWCGTCLKTRLSRTCTLRLTICLLVRTEGREFRSTSSMKTRSWVTTLTARPGRGSWSSWEGSRCAILTRSWKKCVSWSKGLTRSWKMNITGVLCLVATKTGKQS